MPTVQVSFEDLPPYRWPIHKEKGSAGYSMIQATNEEGTLWIDRWVLVDADGENLAIIDIQDLDDNPELAAAQIAEAGLRVVQEIHGITPEETGLECEVRPGVAVHQDPPGA